MRSARHSEGAWTDMGRTLHVCGDWSTCMPHIKVTLSSAQINTACAKPLKSNEKCFKMPLQWSEVDESKLYYVSVSNGECHYLSSAVQKIFRFNCVSDVRFGVNNAMLEWRVCSKVCGFVSTWHQLCSIEKITGAVNMFWLEKMHITIRYRMTIRNIRSHFPLLCSVQNSTLGLPFRIVSVYNICFGIYTENWHKGKIIL